MSLPSAPQFTQPELGFFPGESMAFEVQLAGILVGEAQLAVGEIGMVDGRRAIVVKSRAATAGAAALLRKMVDESTTTIDVETGRPMQVDTVVINGDKQITANAKFTGSIASISVSPVRDRKPQILRSTSRPKPCSTCTRRWRTSAAARSSGDDQAVYTLGGRRLAESR
jgi:hypothetical protein